MADPKKYDWEADPAPSSTKYDWETDATAQRIVDRIPQSTHEMAVEGLKDAANVAPAGAAFERDDEIAGGLAVIGQAIKDPLNFNRTSAGRAFDAAQSARQASKDESDRRSPNAAIGGRVAGAVAGSAVLGGVGGAVAKTLPTLGRAIQTAGGVGKAADGASKTARAAQWVANAAVPGAIQGSDSGQALEGAATGVGVSGAFALPGVIARGFRAAAPAVQKWAANLENKSYLEAYGTPAGTMNKIAQEPGGQAGYVQRMRELGLTHRLPNPQKGVERTTEIAKRLNAEREVMASSQPDLRISSVNNAQRVRNMAEDRFAPGGERDLRAEAAKEAEVLAGLGDTAYETVGTRQAPEAPYVREYVQDPIEATVGPMPMSPQERNDLGAAMYASREAAGSPQLPAKGSPLVPPAPPGSVEPIPQPSALARRGGSDVIRGELEPPSAGGLPQGNNNAVERYIHTSPLVPGEVVQETRSLGRQMTLPQQSREIAAYNDQAYNKAGQLDSRGAEVPRLVGSALNDEAELALNKVAPDLGTEWRANKLDTARTLRMHEAASEGAAKPARLAPLARAGRAVGSFAAGAAAGGPATGVVAMLAGEAAANPAVRMNAYRGLGAVSKAVAGTPNTALGKFLARAPGGTATTLGSAAGRGMQAVEAAAERGPDAMATEHYLQNQTNSEYNKAVNRPDSEE